MFDVLEEEDQSFIPRAASGLSVLFSDTFTGIDGTLLSDHNALWVLVGGYGGTVSIQSNKAQSTLNSNSLYYISGFAAQADQQMQFDMSECTTDFRVYIRETGDNHDNYAGYKLHFSSMTDYKIYKRVAGSETELASGTYVDAGTNTIVFSAIGTTVKLTVNGVILKTVTDSDVATGRPALFFNSPPTAEIILDNFIYSG